ncbi:MAG: LysM peptidoglycan-binding domain-containing protein [Puniceicoccales bacterium]|jgi:LysM repeat protein|nr:LysM peptidoglycan-binding domain-containing protein [Puniceicoccales bacterium]
MLVKKILIRLGENILIMGIVLLAGCQTPSLLQRSSSKGPSPEDTFIKRSDSTSAARERVFTEPLRPEPEEVLIVEPEIVEIPKEPVKQWVGADYTVQRGDCLYGLAKRYGLRVQDLLEANSLEKSAKLFVGQKLILPGVTEEQLLRSRSTEYVVQRGDCLSKIAQKYGLKVREIKAANGMKSDRIIAGKRLIIPERGRYAQHKNATPAKTQKPFVVDDNGYYTLQRGDVLSKVAARAKVTVADLQKWNNITDPSRIQIGQKILVKPKMITETINSIHSEPTAPTTTSFPVAQKEVPLRRYDFIDDADFFGKIDEIPILQVHD